MLQWSRELRTPVLQHKRVQLNQKKLDRAKRVLGAKTETGALNRALDVVVDEAGVDAALKKGRRRGRLRKAFL